VPKTMCLVRCPFIFAARFNIVLVAKHVPGVENGAADALSWNDSASFFTWVPWARRQSSGVPEELRRALVEQPMEWTSAEAVERLISDSLSENTRKAYAVGW